MDDDQLVMLKEKIEEIRAGLILVKSILKNHEKMLDQYQDSLQQFRRLLQAHGIKAASPKTGEVTESFYD